MRDITQLITLFRSRDGEVTSVKTRRLANNDLMLAQRLGRWASIKPAIYLVLTGMLGISIYSRQPYLISSHLKLFGWNNDMNGKIAHGI